ncbi:MAG: hypothetical protein ABIG64_00275 [Candidatus Omnitrophota bacterium]
MDKKQCKTCSSYRNCKDSFSSWIFFLIGIIATVAIRLITILIHVNPLHAKISWYVGIIGFTVFFVYKFKIIISRSKRIEKTQIFQRINAREKLKDSDYNFLGEILCSLSSKKEQINYLFIFVLSAVALILAIYFDFVK